MGDIRRGIPVFDPEPIAHALFAEREDGDDDIREAPSEVFAQQLEWARERVEKGYCGRDLWDVGGWFLKLIPDMLEEYKSSRHGSPGRLGENYTNEAGFVVNDKCHAEWDGILDRLIFLFRESVEETCSKSNELADEHLAAFDAFTEKYGLMGERFGVPEGGPDPDEGEPYRRVHFMDEDPAYADIHGRWQARERELEAYREDCRKQAMTLFTEWMMDICD